MGNILKNGIDFGGLGMGKIIKNGIEFSGTTVIVEKPATFFDDGQWLNTDKMSFNTVGGGISGKKLVFTHSAVTQDAIGIATQTKGMSGDYAVLVKIKNTSAQNVNLQYGESTPGYNVTQIVMQGQGRLQYYTDTIPPNTERKYFVKSNANGVFFGVYAYNDFSFEIEQIPFLN